MSGQVAVEEPAASPGVDSAAGAPRDRVEVRLPAQSAYLSVLRTATAGLAARLDFTLDEIEDLRIAVDEACGMLLSQTLPGSDLRCAFELDGDTLVLTVTAATRSARLPSRDTFGWTVLTALAGDVDASLEDGADGTWLSTIALRKRRGLAGAR